MARLTIQLDRRSQAGSVILLVELASDEDATPREHEHDHRRLVSALFPNLDFDGQNADRVVVERVAPLSQPCLGCSGGDDDYQVIDLG